MNAVEAAYRHHRVRIHRFIRRRVGSADEADDVVQDVFADASAALSASILSEEDTLRWLYVVARRRLADRARRHTTRQRARASAVRGKVQADGASDYGVDVARAIATVIAGLPERQRRAVVWKLVEGRRFAEIARGLATSEGAARMTFARGITSVRAALREKGVEP